MLKTILVLAAGLLTGAATAQETVSLDEGSRIARIGGCHDCHTPGFGEANGDLDPSVALIGSPVGYQGPWGTTYAANLRLVAGDMSEDDWVEYMATIQSRPPMPWFNLHYMTESESRSLYQYIVSLGDQGEPAPEYVPPGETATTPFLVFVPQMPQ
ncbi:hypothetical protein GCM10007989_01260 [Devosia pacifica]|uniref:Cytochrome C n=1 Tax=Devosia pacifica TaxID=1335967 RepID=A0A918RUR2_9HYPH|nr:cytochrome C [Devosia pacifica]GHA10769.1 hypothetical protein GCM10007989_01260 [Devosia pacifica]